MDSLKIRGKSNVFPDNLLQKTGDDDISEVENSEVEISELKQ